MVAKELYIELKSFIDIHTSRPAPAMVMYQAAAPVCSIRAVSSEENEIDGYIKEKLKPSFSKVLFDFIDKKGTQDSSVYKKAGIDRRHFSKIRSNPGYRPGKNTVIALALALELDQKEADLLLRSSGYALSDSETLDLVIQFCIQKKIFDINDVNSLLDYLSLKPLIGAAEW